LLYDGAEAKVYQYKDVLPRASVYYRADLQQGEKNVLRRLADPSLDIFESVVLDFSKLSAEQRIAIDRINSEPSRRVQAGLIKTYKSQIIDIQASLEQDGILVLNDSDYPGWTVDVDNHSANWLTANYIFRGVLLRKGEHNIRFSYRPKSFYIRVVISVATLFCVTLFGFHRRRSSEPTPSP
jgi:Bacterial membrane protein YfhO